MTIFNFWGLRKSCLDEKNELVDLIINDIIPYIRYKPLSDLTCHKIEQARSKGDIKALSEIILSESLWVEEREFFDKSRKKIEQIKSKLDKIGKENEHISDKSMRYSLLINYLLFISLVLYILNSIGN